MEIEIKPSEIQLIFRNVIPFVFYRLEMQFNFQYPCIKYSVPGNMADIATFMPSSYILSTKR